jgi:hypothetical protein
MRHDSEGVLTMASSGKPEESAQPPLPAPNLSRTALVEINARHFHYNRYAHDRSGRSPLRTWTTAGSAKGCQFYICTERAPQALHS